MKHISIAAFDYSGNKLCDLYDSDIKAAGQAYDPVQEEEIGGWKQLTFSLPYLENDKENFRWDYVKAEYLIRLRVDSATDWFLLQTPKRDHGKLITNTVVCPHISTVLKTKNLYVTFDDETGIGKIDYLIGRALTNTGWSIGTCDVFYEADGETEKVRSLKSEGKQGAYQLITDICNLFKAYPVYNGDTKTVDIHALKDKLPVEEMWTGKNLSSLSVTNDSGSLITRLYVEGDYGDFGYVGIDDVNPTGLSYLLNFDYYRSIGIMSQEQEDAYADYMENMPACVAAISAKMREVIAKENELNTLWGQPDYVLYLLNNKTVSRYIIGGTVTDAQKEISEGDEFLVFKAAGNYRTLTAGAGGVVDFATDDLYALKFITLPAGTIGAKQVAIEAKEKLITELQKDYDKQVDPIKKEDILGQITNQRAAIQDIYNGTEDATGLYEAMRTAVMAVIALDGLNTDLTNLQEQQADIEATFAAIMGDLLKDGYWSDSNYTVGQEASLYADAVDMMTEVSKPTVTYTFSLYYLVHEMGIQEDTPKLNTKIHIIDDKLKINDYAYISKRSLHLDKPQDDTVEISNTDITLSGQSFQSILSRITELSDLIDQKNTLYNRAGAINSDGNIFVDRLTGSINLLQNRLSSSVANWYTDDKGSIIFEAVDGSSAMMLTGNGFMIANGKTEDGDWNWRTKAIGSHYSNIVKNKPD